MKGFYRLIATIIIATFFAFPALANKVEPGFRGIGGEFGVVYECAFPNTVKLDGDLEDQPWRFAPWHFTDNKTGTGPAPDEKDASYTFAAVADDEWLYVAFKVSDDKIKSGENAGCDVWNDDSVEIYIDGKNDKAGAHDQNDAQITIGADNIGGDVNKPKLGGCVGVTQGPQTGTILVVVKTNTGWAVEAAVPLKNQGWNIQPKDGMKIGFNTHFNDDDDGGGRDHKLIWSKKDVDDQSWTNPQRFAELKFVEVVLSVEPVGKLTTKWGQLKTLP